MWVKKNFWQRLMALHQRYAATELHKSHPHYHDGPGGVVISDKAKLHAHTMLDLRVVRCGCHCNWENALK